MLLLPPLLIATPIVIREMPISLSFTLSLNLTGGTVVDVDRTRLLALTKLAGQSQYAADPASKRDVYSVDVVNTAITYTTTVGVGTPPTQYTLLVDTGSSNTWIGAKAPYIQSKSSLYTGSTVWVYYGSGAFAGEECEPSSAEQYVWRPIKIEADTDSVSLSNDLIVANQSIGVASLSIGFEGFDGILGLGPADLTLRTVSNEAQAIPTITDNLFAQGQIASNLFAVSYSPITIEPTTDGELTFGSTDSSKYTGEVNYAPITSTSPSSSFWGVNQTITYGDGVPIMDSSAGIVDTGTTLIYIGSDAFQRYQNATGASYDGTTGLLRVSADQYSNLQSLFFNIGGVSYELTPNA